MLIAPAAVSAAVSAGRIAEGTRLVGFDMVRAFAALLVIWHHSGRSAPWDLHNLNAIGGLGTAALNLFAGYFVAQAFRKPETVRSPWAFAWHRVTRIYGAFVVWSLLYALARAVNYALFGKVTGLSLGWNIAFYGTTYHLWFLPYLTIASLLAVPLMAYAARSPERAARCAGVVAIVAMGMIALPALGLVDQSMTMQNPVGRMFIRSPGFLIGLAFGLWVLSGRRFQPRLPVVWAAGAVVVLATYLAVVSHVPSILINRVAAVAALVIALAPWRGPIAAWIARFGRLGFGVYLCHVLFTEALVSAAGAFHIEPTLARDAAVFVVASVCSFGLAYAMRTVRSLAWLIP